MRLTVWLGAAAVAFVLRVVASMLIGPFPFGPDAPGVDAALVLGGHPYPLHPWLVSMVGDQRLTSILGGLVTAMACAQLGGRLGNGALGAGLVAACAPLLVLVGALDGGDAPAVGMCALGLALAFSGRPFLGGAVAALALGVKPVVAPLLVPLVLAPLVGDATTRRRVLQYVLLAIGTGLGLLAVHWTVLPLFRPKEASGILGSWFMATNGSVPQMDQLPALVVAGFTRLWDLPVWTGHPILGGLALFGAALPGRHRRVRIALAVLAAGTMLATSTLLGDGLNPRWIAAASVPLVVLAGIALRRVPYLAVVFAWPALAYVDGLAAMRATQDPGTASPIGIPWPLDRSAPQQFDSSSICNASQLRALHLELLDHPGPVTVQPLRDGREGELTWPLQAARPDLEIRITPDDPLVYESEPCVYAIR
ncbi:MAG: hypothetical protein GY913_24320 [Proteobacteria bacterium]|nr:hypothetical protein [Pseudomonadota bacterium]MCP4920041.1 hypothetical protein [Pseudomonadota bacterium]